MRSKLPQGRYVWRAGRWLLCFQGFVTEGQTVELTNSMGQRKMFRAGKLISADYGRYLYEMGAEVTIRPRFRRGSKAVKRRIQILNSLKILVQKT